MRSLESTKISISGAQSGAQRPMIKRMRSEPLLLTPKSNPVDNRPIQKRLKKMESEPVLISNDGKRLGRRSTLVAQSPVLSNSAVEHV